MRLDGKVALIVGGASGIGRATALLFAEEGAAVVVADLGDGQDVAGQIRGAGGRAIFCSLDVTDAAQVRAVVKTTLDSFGRLDILFNSAGRPGKRGGPAEIEEEAWDACIEVNLRGSYLVCRYAIPALVASGGGSIINVSSIAALEGGGPPLTGPTSAYATAKAGVIAMTNTIAYAYGHQGIRANTVIPGCIETPMTQRLFKYPNFLQGVIDSTPLRRWGQPEEVARVALFFASDDSSFVSGQYLVVDGASHLTSGKVFVRESLDEPATGAEAAGGAAG